jgi:hypothetical protein
MAGSAKRPIHPPDMMAVVVAASAAFPSSASSDRDFHFNRDVNLCSHLVHGPLYKLTIGNMLFRFHRPGVRIEQSAGVNIGAPNRTNFLQLFVNNASITPGLNVGSQNGFVAGNLVLMMLRLDTARDNRNPAQRDAS